MTKEYEETEPLVEEELDDTAEDHPENVVDLDDANLTYEELMDRVRALEETNANMADQFIRAKAETENTRRIKEQEVAKARKFALEGFAKELLQVKDSLDQASQVQLSDDSDQSLIEQMQEGLGLTLRQLETVFDKFNIDEVSPEAGDDLDPELHQPMAMQPSDSVAANKVVQTIQKGFTLNDRLLRAAMVIVSSGPAK